MLSPGKATSSAEISSGRTVGGRSDSVKECPWHVRARKASTPGTNGSSAAGSVSGAELPDALPATAQAKTARCRQQGLVSASSSQSIPALEATCSSKKPGAFTPCLSAQANFWTFVRQQHCRQHISAFKQPQPQFMQGKDVPTSFIKGKGRGIPIVAITTATEAKVAADFSKKSQIRYADGDFTARFARLERRP